MVKKVVEKRESAAEAAGKFDSSGRTVAVDTDIISDQVGDREGVMLRRMLLLVFAAGMAVSNSGCLINMYSATPLTRIDELLTVSENLRQIEAEWRRFWFVDEPSHLTYERIHGGVQ